MITALSLARTYSARLALGFFRKANPHRARLKAAVRLHDYSVHTV